MKKFLLHIINFISKKRTFLKLSLLHSAGVGVSSLRYLLGNFLDCSRMVEIKQSCKGLLASSNANENIESYTHKQSVKTRLPHQLKIGDFIGNYLRAGLVGLLSVEVWEYVTGQQYGQVNSKQGNLKMIQFASNTVLQNQ